MVSPSEETLYVRTKKGVGTLIISIYVDDIVYTGSSDEMVKEFTAEMMCKYEMSDLGLLHHFLGMGVTQTEGSIFIHQKKYALTLLDKFGLKDCKSVSTPLVATDKLQREMEVKQQMKACTEKFGAFSWASVKQHSVALSTAEAEYVSAAEATSQAIWLRFVLEDFGEEQTTATTVFCDNTSAIAMAKNPVFHQRSKRIKRKFHFIREAIQEGVIELLYCKGEEQIADIFTKALPKDRFSYLRNMLGVKSASTLEGSEREKNEARAAEGGRTVVVHHKGRKKTTDAESGITVVSVAQAVVEDKVARKKRTEVGLDFIGSNGKKLRGMFIFCLPEIHTSFGANAA
ncbi:hypothetical protein Prudu_9S000200 [Prunus dulcis]|uniref:Reverse transcriptase Ty1/copia-type domain-containing protein n=2 Tax=Prunus dulcis TaxID=3755 RepID=A0A5H2XL80_PRUDU|nr:hypothetical protein Prudu_9S000200 [Prunus dulcis]